MTKRRPMVLLVVAAALVAIMGVTTTAGGSCLSILERPIRQQEGMPAETGWIIVYKDYDLQLEDGIFNLFLLGIFSPGEYSRTELRASRIAQSLEHAYDLLSLPGSALAVRPEGQNHAIYVVGSWDDNHTSWKSGMDQCSQFRVMTVFPQDARLFGRASGDQEKLAHYIVAQIRAHHLLFSRKSEDIADYENLRLDSRTRTGKIFKEVFLRTKEYTEEKRGPFSERNIQEAMHLMAESQRERLHMLAVLMPRDWGVRAGDK